MGQGNSNGHKHADYNAGEQTPVGKAPSNDELPSGKEKRHCWGSISARRGLNNDRHEFSQCQDFGRSLRYPFTSAGRLFLLRKITPSGLMGHNSHSFWYGSTIDSNKRLSFTM